MDVQSFGHLPGYADTIAISTDEYDRHFKACVDSLRAGFSSAPGDAILDAVRYGICEWFSNAPYEVFVSQNKSHAWIVQVARRALMRELRRMRRLTALPDVEADDEEHRSPVPHILIDHSSSSLLGTLIVENLFRNLSSTVAQAMQLHVIEGFTVNEIANIQQCSNSTVKKRLKGGYARLRNIVRKDECNW